MRSSILEFAPNYAAFEELSADERAWLILEHIKQKGGREHSSNLMLDLTSLFDAPLHSGVPADRAVESALRDLMSEALGRLVSLGLVAIDFEQPAMFHLVTGAGNRVDTEAAFSDFLTEDTLPSKALHGIIQSEAYPLYRRGKFDLAVFEAFKQVEIAVRAGANLSDDDIGRKLMSKAFNENDGPLSDQSLPSAERGAIMHLFMGAVGAFKNPNSHREVGLDDPIRAAELLMFASHLLRMVDNAETQ